MIWPFDPPRTAVLAPFAERAGTPSRAARALVVAGNLLQLPGGCSGAPWTGRPALTAPQASGSRVTPSFRRDSESRLVITGGSPAPSLVVAAATGGSGRDMERPNGPRRMVNSPPSSAICRPMSPRQFSGPSSAVRARARFYQRTAAVPVPRPAALTNEPGVPRDPGRADCRRHTPTPTHPHTHPHTGRRCQAPQPRTRSESPRPPSESDTRGRLRGLPCFAPQGRARRPAVCPSRWEAAAARGPGPAPVGASRRAGRSRPVELLELPGPVRLPAGDGRETGDGRYGGREIREIGRRLAGYGGRRRDDGRSRKASS